MRMLIPDDVLKARLATDEKCVRRIAKRVAMLVQAPTAQDKEALSLLLKSDITQFHEHIERLRYMAETATTAEIQSYDAAITSLRTSCPCSRSGEKSAAKQEAVDMLKKRLASAKQLRMNVAEYNTIANKILVYPSREDMMRYVAPRS